MLDERFVILGFILSLIGGISYTINTLKGKVKPNRVTWFMWTLAPMVAFAAEIGEGVGLVSLMTFSVGFNPLLVFLASFVNKKSYWKIKTFDIFCGALSLLGLLLWYIFQSGNIAIFFSILADGLAALPTVAKSYHFPQTEDYKIYFLSGLNATITLLTIKVWDFSHIAFPIYILLLCTLLTFLIKYKLGSRLNN